MFAPLKRAARAIFIDDLRLQRDADGLRIVLHNSTGPVLSPEERARQALEQQTRAEVHAMLCDLAELFESMPGSRRVLRHLTYVEQQLREHGLALLNDAPLSLLRQALNELEDAVINWSPRGLATLRSKMAVAVRERDGTHEGAAGAGAEVPVSLAQMPRPEVSEQPLHSLSNDTNDPDQQALLAAYEAVDINLERV
jgi:hypothetical protein